MNEGTRTEPFQELVNLASERLGARAIAANDDFFAPKESLVKVDPPIWIDHKYTDRGKWMDGWETRRRRDEGHDWCVIALGAPGIIRGVDVETTHFKGNHPEACAIDVVALPPAGEIADLERVAWQEILPTTVLAGDAHNLFAIEDAPAATHVRLRIYPDGGVARLRLYGEVVADWDRLSRQPDVDLAAVENGGFVLTSSDMFFGPRQNLIMPGDATHMGDGWETRRRRGPGHDWAIIRLGHAGRIRRAVVDTRFFKGNAPGWCSLEVTAVEPATDSERQDLETATWRTMLDKTTLSPDAVRVFETELREAGPCTHVRFNIYPDGGVARLRLFGHAERLEIEPE